MLGEPRDLERVLQHSRNLFWTPDELLKHRYISISIFIVKFKFKNSRRSDEKVFLVSDQIGLPPFAHQMICPNEYQSNTRCNAAGAPKHLRHGHGCFCLQLATGEATKSLA